MQKARTIIYYLLIAIGIILMLASALSLLQNTDNRYLKMLDFPRIQVFLAGAVLLPLYAVLFPPRNRRAWLFVAGLVGVLLLQGSYLWPYSTLSSTAIASEESPLESRRDRTIRLVLANVLMDNRQSESLLQIVEDRQPDLLLLMEVDDWWMDAVQPVKASYPYRLEQPNDKAYGMALYSRWPISQDSIAYLSNENVPSFHFTLQLPTGQQVRVHTVHPVPPKQFADLPDNAGQEEVALTKVGRMVVGDRLPAIVTGDFNDVAWARTVRLMQAEGQLHDVRVGRGFYNSFDAHAWYMRWPLDHVLVTKEFRVAQLERLGHIGSDHFPIYAELVLQP